MERLCPIQIWRSATCGQRKPGGRASGSGPRGRSLDDA